MGRRGDDDLREDAFGGQRRSRRMSDSDCLRWHKGRKFCFSPSSRLWVRGRQFCFASSNRLTSNHQQRWRKRRWLSPPSVAASRDVAFSAPILFGNFLFEIDYTLPQQQAPLELGMIRAMRSLKSSKVEQRRTKPSKPGSQEVGLYRPLIQLSAGRLPLVERILVQTSNDQVFQSYVRQGLR